MTVIKVKKYLFIGLNKDLKTFFLRAQDHGFIEFINQDAKKSIGYPDHVQKIMKALSILKKQPLIEIAPLTEEINLEECVDHILNCSHSIDQLEEKSRLLEVEINRIRPIGDFSFDLIDNIEKETGRFIRFFCRELNAKHSNIDNEELIPISTEYDMEYFMQVSKCQTDVPGLIELHFDKSLSQLKYDFDQTISQIMYYKQLLKKSVAYLDRVKSYLVTTLNQVYLSDAEDSIVEHLDNHLFSVDGWIPENRLYGLFPLLEGLGICYEEVAIGPHETIPTYMENKGYGKVGEDLVHIYDTPSSADKDPSTSVFWGFAVFFAMIISDAGYGALFLAVALLLRWKCRHLKAKGKRFLTLLTTLSIFCIGWGVLSGSYFGIELAPDSSLNQLSVIDYMANKKADYHVLHKDETWAEFVHLYPHLADIYDGAEFLQAGVVIKDGLKKYVVYNDFKDAIFMEIALLIGVLHISFSLLRCLLKHWAGIGWVLASVGSYLFFPKFLHATSLVNVMGVFSKADGYIIGMQLLCGGVVIALILGLLQNKWGGFMELAKPIELFADVLSYLRLYALGLAAMILASTFNDMGLRLGFVAGLFVILMGHTINIAVGIMGGTIHGLRLNFIEWYHHSFEGGGKLFHPLKRLNSKGE